VLASSPRAQRILLVALARTVHSEIEEALRLLDAGHVLYWVSQGEQVQARAEELEPDVILVDDGLPDVSDLIGHLARTNLTGTIIFLASANATDAIADATFAGARSFLAKPVRPEALARILAQVQAHGRSHREGPEALGRTVVFCAPKGGTGRTTLAVNTAIGLIQEGESNVALVDADYAAPAVDVVLNLYPERTIVDLLPRLEQMDESLLQGVMAEHASGLRVLMAPEPDGRSAPVSPAQAQQVLALLGRLYRWTIVDLGLPMDETAWGFVDAADLVILSVLPEMAGLRNMRLLIDQLLERGVEQERLWVVLNRATITGGVSTTDIEKRLHTPVRYRVPDDQPLVTQSVNRGVPVVLGNRSGALVRALHGLALGVRRSLAEPEAPREGRRLFGRSR
jgi:pilus assembly protein CpaE